MAMAQAVSSGTGENNDGWYDDKKLATDYKLQESLLNANPALRQRFNEFRENKPADMDILQFTRQFWSSRVHLLRAHAIEKAQTQGEYNVLPEIKFTRVTAEREGEADSLRLNLTKEQIILIFKQYPIVREAYNDNVPNKVAQNDFWSRFFNSRLLKKLKGQKVTDDDPPDPILDRYLDYRDRAPTNLGQVPHFIDLEGNEQNHSQMRGNRPDETMRPSSYDKVPILRILNNLSEKMLSQVAPTDTDPHAPIGMDEETFNELQLRDLQADANDNRVTLNIKDQQLFAAGERGGQLSADAAIYARQNPDKVLSSLRSDLSAHLASDAAGGIRLGEAIGVQSDSDDSGDEADGHANGAIFKKKTARVGSKTTLITATSNITASIRNRKAATSDDVTSTRGLLQTTFDTLTMTHNTTVEFLHYFWTLFLSGDASRTSELAKLVETLDKSVDRINAVMSTAEEERARAVQGLRNQMQGLNPKGNKRRRLELDVESLGGGKKVVEEMVAPTIKAIREATERYRKAFEEQSATA